MPLLGKHMSANNIGTNVTKMQVEGWWALHLASTVLTGRQSLEGHLSAARGRVGSKG